MGHSQVPLNALIQQGLGAALAEGAHAAALSI